MTISTKLGASRAAFLSAASALPMLRGPTITLSPEDDTGATDGGGFTDNDGQDSRQGGQDDNSGDDRAAEGDGEDEGEGGQPKPKPKQSAQERIDELTRLRRAAEARAEKAERDLEEARKPPAPKAPVKEDKEPDAKDYEYGETDPNFIRDLTRWETRQTIAAEAKAQADREAVAHVERTWEERQNEFAKDHPDYFEKTAADDLAITPPMAGAIQTAEGGAAVAYHLAENPDEARRIAALAPLAQVREIGRLQGRLEAQQQANNPTDTDTPPRISSAPPPPPKARGQGGRFVVAPDTDDFDAFEKAHGGKA